MSDEVKITIEESPYGDTGAVYDGMLGMMQHFRLQLISYRTQNKTPEERAYLEADISGYEEVIKTGSQDAARLFIKTKQEGRSKFENNIEVIKHLKEQGLWP